MWEKFKMEVFNTSFYNERDGFTTFLFVRKKSTITNVTGAMRNLSMSVRKKTLLRLI